MLHLRPNMMRLNPNTPKHTDFVDITHFMHHATIMKSLCNQFKGAIQDRIAENSVKHDLFQLLGNKSDPQTVKNLSENYNFEKNQTNL